MKSLPEPELPPAQGTTPIPRGLLGTSRALPAGSRESWSVDVPGQGTAKGTGILAKGAGGFSGC